jgi:hypothetical protein
MPEQMWPFLIARSRDAGYRVVVIPDLLSGGTGRTGRTGEIALGSAATPVDLPAGGAAVRELRGLDDGPISIVYRSVKARRGDIGLPDDGPLTDRYGREFSITEGVVLRGSARAVAGVGITLEDLDRAHTLVMRGFGRFWQEGETYQAEVSQPYFPVTDMTTGTAEPSERPSSVRLVPVDPWNLDSIRSALPELTQRPTELVLVAPDDQTSTRTPRGARIIGAVGASLAGVIALAVLGAVSVHLLHHRSPASVVSTAPPSTSPPTASAMLGSFCAALDSGHLDAAYDLTTTRFRAKLDAAAFDQELVGANSKAAACSSTLGSASASTAAATATLSVTAAGQSPTIWSVALTHESDGAWLIAGLSR